MAIRRILRVMPARWLLGLALVASSACYVTAPVKPAELVLLDGYQDGQPKGGTVYLLSPANQKIEVASDSEVYLDVEGHTYGGAFRSIRVGDGVFTGVTGDGQAVQVPLGSIEAARIREPNHAVTNAAYVVGGLAILIALGLGVIVAVTATSSGPVEGRALRVAGRAVTARAVGAEGWADAPSAPIAVHPPELRDCLARLWTQTARGEHASVPAFSRLALSLVALGAPARLIEAAHRAALEEIDHARLAFSLAGAYAGVPTGPGRLPQLESAPAVTARSLGELAVQSLVDGCLLEGVAAEVARRALVRARDGAARAALSVIARDEAGHAQLAWDVVDWCCACGGDLVRRQLTVALRRAPVKVKPPEIPDHLADALADHGWLGAATWDDAFRDVRAYVAGRLIS